MTRSSLVVPGLWIVLARFVHADDASPDKPPPLVTQEIEGWSVVLGQDILTEERRDDCRKAITALANHLQRIRYIVPEDRLEKLVKLPIWLAWHNEKLSSRPTSASTTSIRLCAPS
jgi:hypothetical protein